MMRAIARIERHPWGPRFYLAGRRVHHGPLGVAGAIAALALRQRALAAALLAYGATDWRDFPFTDRCNHPPRKGRT